MTSRNSRALLPCLAAVLLLVGAGPAKAQQRSLQIRDGEVRVDNKVVPPEQLPVNLKVKGVNLTSTFEGISQPVIRIGDHYYVITDSGISELDAERYRSIAATGAAAAVPGEAQWYRDELADPMTQSQMREFDKQAAKFRELSEEITTQEGDKDNRLAEEMKQTARMAAEMAAELPRVQVTSYWDQVKAADRDLYNELVREWQLEAQIQQLAYRIKQMSAAGEDTKSDADRLRGLLGEAFELKQKNRAREIEQLERQLEGLEAEMKKRNQAKNAIIDRRLRELVDR